MRKSILFLFILLTPFLVEAQATSGSHRVNQVLSRAPTGLTAQIVPNAKITVTNTATGTSAVIYRDPQLTVRMSPPVVTGDSNGNYDYYFPQNVCLTETITASGFGSKTIPNICSNGGTTSYPVSGVAVSTSAAWGASLVAPTGAIVGTTDAQTLTNKTVDGVTTTTFGFLDPTSSVQTQLNSKLPLGGGTLTGNLTSPAVNSVVNAALLPGLDIGDAITTKLAAAPVGTIEIPDGTYNFSHTISITQNQFQTLTIHCNSRDAVLNYTGTGDAVFITSQMNSAAQVTVENCSIFGGSAGAGANGIHLFDSQNVRLVNDIVYNFNGDNLYAVGSTDAVYTGSDFSTAGHYNVHLAPDPVNQFASTANRFYGGSMTFGGLGNFWDAGDFSAYGGDTSNTLDGVTLEMSANTPQFIIEGTKNDAISNSYIEYVNFATSTGDLYGGIIGNYTGSGYGCNCTFSAVGFRFIGNHMTMPAAAVAHTDAALLLANTNYLYIQGLFGEGSPTYAISFYASGTNTFDFIEALNVGYATSIYQNPVAAHNRLWTLVDAAPGLGQFTVYNDGQFHVGGLVSTNNVTATANFSNSHGTVIPSAVTGFHGSGGVKIQLSDNTGVTDNLAKFGADGSIVDSGVACCGGAGTGSAFGSLTGGTNTAAAMVVGTGSTLAATGSGTITATAVPFAGVAAGTSAAALVIGTGGSLAPSGTGTVTANALAGTPPIAVTSCTGCQHGSTGTTTYTTSTTLSLADDGMQVAMQCATACTVTLPAVQPSTTWHVPLIISIGAGAATVVLGGSDTFNGSVTPPLLPLAVWANSTFSTGYRGQSFASAVGPVADVTVSISSFLIPSNTCYGSTGSTTPATFSMPGITTAMGVGSHFTGNPTAINGWGATGGLNIAAWASSADTGSYVVCNPTTASITGGAIVFRMVAQ